MLKKENNIEYLVIKVDTLQVIQTGQDAMSLFENAPNSEGIIVLENERPVGLIMRTLFYKKLGTLFGHSLFLNRPVEHIMDKIFLIVDVNESISNVALLSMQRNRDNIYDFILVLKDDKYIGVISMRLFFIELSDISKKQLDILKFQNQDLIKANEQEKELKKDLQKKSEAEKILLDNAGQGFLFFGNDLVIRKEYSAECIKIFEQNLDNKNYIQLISSFLDQDKMEVMKFALSSYFQNDSLDSDNAYLELLPKECIVKNKNITFEYKKIITFEKKSVIVILTDITDKKELQIKMEKEQENLRLIVRTLTYQSQIKNLIGDFKELFKGKVIEIDNNCMKNEILRLVHTYKGDFAQYGFINSSHKLHEIEKQINDLNNYEIEGLSHIINIFDADKILEEDMNIINNALGENFLDSTQKILIEERKFDEIESYFKNSSSCKEKEQVLKILSSIRLTDVKVYLRRYEDYINYLSMKLMKNMPSYSIVGDDILIDEKKYGKLLKTLPHIFRNIMDHGIEYADERFEKGKSENGNIICSVFWDCNNSFSISIKDDGRGINIDNIRNKAFDLKLFTNEQLDEMSNQEIINLIFLDNLSTKEEVDSLSGRGVGMAAIKRECERMGGCVKATSVLENETNITISLPYCV